MVLGFLLGGSTQYILNHRSPSIPSSDTIGTPIGTLIVN